MSGTSKILIIDDEIDLCFLLKDYFVRTGFDVWVAHSLSEGKTMMDLHQPAILFLDNNLPDGTGWSYAPVLAAGNPGMFIVFMGSMNTKLPEMPAGADYQVLTKPIGIADLNKQFAKFR